MERPLRGLASRGATSAPLEGPPPRPLEAKAISDSLEGRPLGPLDAWTDSTSPETALGGPERRPNRPTGRGAFTHQLLHGMGRGLGGVRRRQLASAIMPHSGYDSHHCATYSLYLFPLQDPRGAWAMTTEHSTSLNRSQASAFNTLDASPYSTWGSTHFYSHHHAVDWCHRTRTRSWHGR